MNKLCRIIFFKLAPKRLNGIVFWLLTIDRFGFRYIYLYLYPYYIVSPRNELFLLSTQCCFFFHCTTSPIENYTRIHFFSYIVTFLFICLLLYFFYTSGHELSTRLILNRFIKQSLGISLFPNCFRRSRLVHIKINDGQCYSRFMDDDPLGHLSSFTYPLSTSAQTILFYFPLKNNNRKRIFILYCSETYNLPIFITYLINFFSRVYSSFIVGMYRDKGRGINNGHVIG